MVSSRTVKRLMIRGGLLLLIGLLALVGWQAFRVWWAWRGVERIEFDVAGARERLPIAETPVPAVPNPAPEQEPEDEEPFDPMSVLIGERVPDEAFRAYLAIGSDGAADRAGLRADVIILFLLPDGDADPMLVSIPRDLFVTNPCSGEVGRINENLEGCGELATGPEQLALAVEVFTGIWVDHFAILGFKGFAEVVDQLGGVEVCTDHPVRVDKDSPALLPAGCTMVDGDTAMTWLRARALQEYVDGRWQGADNSGDVGRTERQQELLLAILSRLDRFQSPQSMAPLAEDLADAFTLDENLSLGRAISLAWEVRNIDQASIQRPQIDVVAGVTPEGEFALWAQRPFIEVLRAAYPDLNAEPSSASPG